MRGGGHRVSQSVLMPLSIRDRIASYKRGMKADELADILGVSSKTIFRQASKGIIPSYRVGTAVRYDPRLVIDWLAKQ